MIPIECNMSLHVMDTILIQNRHYQDHQEISTIASTIVNNRSLVIFVQTHRNVQKGFTRQDEVVEVGHEVLWLGVRRVSGGAFSGAVCC